MLKTLISEDQTSIDRAGLDVAGALDLAIGGGCPRGRRAEDRILPDRDSLRETMESD
ncbi:MAG: putative molybdenum carrier protein, partial [Candidatus Competibacter sp.]